MITRRCANVWIDEHGWRRPRVWGPYTHQVRRTRRLDGDHGRRHWTDRHVGRPYEYVQARGAHASRLGLTVRRWRLWHRTTSRRQGRHDAERAITPAHCALGRVGRAQRFDRMRQTDTTGADARVRRPSYAPPCQSRVGGTAQTARSRATWRSTRTTTVGTVNALQAEAVFARSVLTMARRRWDRRTVRCAQ